MKKRTVATYARVSTEHEAQVSALENQRQYYRELLKLHPEWEFYGEYVDEGITGTSVNKRKDFQRMMEDAQKGCFDLIITREVSRFARNTVDTLLETRKLKRMGIEVYFTEDNIWTLNDSDGELKLTLMATLAQNESKKISVRVKAGQMISFQNGVPYGTGNILGYDKLPNHGGYVINPEQAETVKMIFDWYLAGNGIRKIQFLLEEAGRKTATGLSNWSCSGVSRILNNAFYCGTVIYRKQYVDDYLNQKRRNNYGEYEKIVVEGKHEPIISKEDFARVQEMLNSRTTQAWNKGKIGIKPSDNIWCKKLICSCGHRFNKRKWHVTKAGYTQYAFQCYNQIKTGSVRYREKKGLPTEGICEAQHMQDWKLYAMAKVIFTTFFEDKEGILKIANELLEKNITSETTNDNEERLKKLVSQQERIKKKFDNLVEMRLADEIPKDLYLTKKEEFQKSIDHIQKQIDELQLTEDLSSKDLDNKLKVLKYALEQDFNFDVNDIPDSVIDAFVDKIVVYKDRFEWYLTFYNDVPIRCIADGTKGKTNVSLLDSTPPFVESDTSCNCL